MHQTECSVVGRIDKPEHFSYLKSTGNALGKKLGINLGMLPREHPHSDAPDLIMPHTHETTVGSLYGNDLALLDILGETVDGT